jgi:hypothetical protein
MRRRPVRWPLALAVAAVACSSSNVVEGARFRCSVSANVDRVHAVRVECPGYQPLVVDVFVENCTALFGSCDAAQAGTLVVQR